MSVQGRKVENPPTTPDHRLDAVRDGFASVPEARAYLKLGHSKLYEMMKNGDLPYAIFGRLRRIPWAALRAFAARMLVNSGTPANAGAPAALLA